MTFEELHSAEKAIGLHDRENVTLRVRWINTLRTIVARRCPTNKVGAPLVTDVDIVQASAEERSEALVKLTAPK